MKANLKWQVVGAAGAMKQRINGAFVMDIGSSVVLWVYVLSAVLCFVCFLFVCTWMTTPQEQHLIYQSFSSRE